MRRGCEQFPRVIRILDDLPEVIQPLVELEKAKKVVFIPPLEHYSRQWSWLRELPFKKNWTPTRTLLFGEDRLEVIELFADGQLDHICIDTEELLAVHVMSVLLYSYLELTWMNQGEIKRILIEFNSVGMRYLESGLELILKAASEGELCVPEPIKQFPLKFCNYTIDCLTPGEPVEAAVYQPAVRKPGKHYLFPFMSPNRAITITGQHMIVVEDADVRWQSWDVSMYRMDRYFYPRNHVQNVRFDQEESITWCTVCVGDGKIEQDIRLPMTEMNAAVLQSTFRP